jgi:hypothetical protein
MSNVFTSNAPVDFWVWVNPDNWLVKHQITTTGGFTSGGILDQRKSNLMFIPNPDFQGFLTPFQFGIMREYMAEYNLEVHREKSFPNYPSRLNAIYLFLSEQEAYDYKIHHGTHVEGRILKKCHSVSSCVYSLHDSSWIDFLRFNTIDAQSVENAANAYWKGIKVQNCQLEILGESWSQMAIFEALFIGRVEFYDRNLSSSTARSSY